MDMLNITIMLVALSQLLVGAGVGLIYSGKRDNALAGAGLIAVSTILLSAFIDFKELEKSSFVLVVIACLWVFVILVTFKAMVKGGAVWNQ